MRMCRWRMPGKLETLLPLLLACTSLFFFCVVFAAF